MSEPADPRTIFTIGHGTRPIGDFLELLRGAGIQRLVDVRTAPGSRRNPQFGKEELAAALADASIAYDWEKDLGGLRRTGPDSRHTAIRNASFRAFADHMETDTFRGALDRLAETSRDTITAIMCAESLWWRCHRRMIADALTVRGWRVIHLMDRGKREPHRLHPNARVVGEEVIYDVEDQPRRSG
ncbi:MAG TPA: DUF488 domain-containing protein [Actinomycetota bacterium]|jgi:uncharacterized protein (DUF488 family)|nr:DUF488 domain-containing protein [Actinomycetota bacterium]